MQKTDFSDFRERKNATKNTTDFIKMKL